MISPESELVTTPPLLGLGAPSDSRPNRSGVATTMLANAPTAPHGNRTHSGLVIERFLQLAERSANAVAARDRDHKVTYGELATRSNDGANHLIERGVPRGQVVGICSVRSVEQIAALFAVMRSGAAFVALDPVYPVERLAATLRATGCRFIIGDSSAEELLHHCASHAHHVTRIPISDLLASRETAEAREDHALPVVAPDNLAYVITTSGSSGTPKCVAISHANIANLVEWANNSFDPLDIANVLWSTSLGFDLSMFEIFVPLSCGGTVTVVNSLFDLVTDPHAHAVTMINTVPSKMTEFFRDGAIPRHVRAVCFAGEPLTADLVDTCYTHGAQNVFNLYGPSETTTYSTAAAIPYRHDGPVPIGLAIRDTQVSIVDPDGCEVHDGAWGELRIGGAGVALGYHNNDELTRERFVTDEHGTRWYNTGDLVSLAMDGQLHYHGRVDDQVKIRGTRIEPGDVEAALRTNLDVADAVVVSLHRRNTTELGALLITLPSATTASVREQLGALLPAVMVPSVFAMVSQLPRLANGKVDRNEARRILGNGAHSADRALTATPALVDVLASSPASSLERDVAACWQVALELDDPPTAHDDFFALGGHSLLAVRLVAHTEARFGIRIPAESLVTHSTVSQYSVLVHNASSNANSEATPSLTQLCIGRDRALAPLIFVIAWPGDVFALRRLNVLSGGSRDIYGITLSSLSTHSSLPSSIGAIARDIVPTLETLSKSSAGVHLSGHSFGGLIAAELAHQLTRGNAPTNVRSLTLFDTAAPPLERARRMARRVVGTWRRHRPVSRGGQTFDTYLVSLNDRYENTTVRYRPRPIDVPTMLVCTGLADNPTNRSSPRARARGAANAANAVGRASEDLGWGNLMNGPLHIIQRAGHHGTIFNDHQFALVVAELMQFLTTIEYNTRLREQSERAQ